MKLEHDFEVAASLADAWPLLLDLERIAPCMPGAQLQEIDGDEYRGIVKVKVGPITAQYRGVARVVEADEAARRVVLRAEGRDTRGQGNAAADIVATLQSEGSKTRVHVDTDLNVTGKVAQFGRGVMADVSAKLMDQFVSCLSTTVLSGGGGLADGAAPAEPTAPAPGPESSPAPPPPASPPPASSPPASSTPVGPAAQALATGPRRIDAPEPEAVDLVRAAGGAVAKRVVPLVAAAVVVVGVVVWLLVR
jgi:carbon monoxide dehydrogenase subunit G